MQHFEKVPGAQLIPANPFWCPSFEPKLAQSVKPPALKSAGLGTFTAAAVSTHCGLMHRTSKTGLSFEPRHQHRTGPSIDRPFDSGQVTGGALKKRAPDAGWQENMQIRFGRGSNGANPVSGQATRISKPPPDALQDTPAPRRGHCLGTKIRLHNLRKIRFHSPNCHDAYVHGNCRQDVRQKPLFWGLATVFMTRDQMKLFAPGHLKSQLWHLGRIFGYIFVPAASTRKRWTARPESGQGLSKISKIFTYANSFLRLWHSQQRNASASDSSVEPASARRSLDNKVGWQQGCSYVRI